jgi:hypothetical protein
LPLHDWLAVHETHEPEPLQTRFVPQLVPAPMLVAVSTHTCAPVAQLVTPALHTLGLVEHEPPAVQETQEPAPLQTRFVPQLAPAPTLDEASTHTGPPLAQEVVPTLQAVGLPVHAAPAVQETQEPVPLQTRFVPQLVPAPMVVAVSTHTCAPVAQLVTPALHVFGLVEQEAPAVQATQEPEPLQTRLVPQLVPAP